jgi:hypothetical protein
MEDAMLEYNNYCGTKTNANYVLKMLTIYCGEQRKKKKRKSL